MKLKKYVQNWMKRWISGNQNRFSFWWVASLPDPLFVGGGCAGNDEMWPAVAL